MGKESNISKSEHLTYIVVPIRFKQSFQPGQFPLLCTGQDTVWEYNPEKNFNSGMVYEHVKFNNNDDVTSLLTFSIKKNPVKGNKSYELINSVWRKLHPEMEISEGKKYKLSFSNEQNNWNSTTLLLSPISGVGLLVFSINPKDASSIDDIIDFNYHLHKIDGQQKLFIPLNVPREELRESKERELLMIRKFLLPESEVAIEAGLTFKLTDIVNMLLYGMPEWKLMEESRAHVFTYCNIKQDTIEMSEDLKKKLVLLTRCENIKYNVPLDDYQGGNHILRTFENIYMGSGIQAGCILTITQQTEDGTENLANGFIKNFPTSNLQHIYLWLYFMALMQRYILLHMITYLSNVSIDANTSVNRNEFNEYIGHFCNLKAKSLFRNVSSFSQHNLYYKFLIQHMEVDQLYLEVEDKMSSIDSYLQLERNRLIGEQNETEKKRNDLLQKEKDDRERRFSMITIAMTILTIIFTMFPNADAVDNVFSNGKYCSLFITFVVYISVGIGLIIYFARKRK